MPRYFTRPKGRFFRVNDELRRMDRAMEAEQQVHGTYVQWYFFDHEHTVMDDIYDEGFVSGGKRYDGPHRMPVMSASTAQGQDDNQGDQGFSTWDVVTLRLAFEQARRAGLSVDLVRDRERHLHDRFVYRDRVFDVTDIQSSGHFDPASRDTTFHVVGMQLRPDELVDSPDFASFSA